VLGSTARHDEVIVELWTRGSTSWPELPLPLDAFRRAVGEPTKPTFESLPGTNVKLRIKSCTATYRRDAGACSWYPNRNLMRIDVLAIPNGQLIPGSARVLATFAHDSWC
jgi:hypothetical protein